MRPSTSRVASRWLHTASYYEWKPGISLDEVIRRWQENGDKTYDDVAMLPTHDLWEHREYTWTREKARSGYAHVRGESVWLSGPQKWDALMEDMRDHGWNPNDPLHLMIGRKGGVKVGEGNHRLAISREIGISQVPVQFQFYSQTVTKSKMPDEEDVIAPKAVLEVLRDEPKKNLSPEEQAQIDELMELIMGFR